MHRLLFFALLGLFVPDVCKSQFPPGLGGLGGGGQPGDSFFIQLLQAFSKDDVKPRYLEDLRQLVCART